jgi:hypothetical protein
VDGEARVASIRRTTAWCSALTPDVRALSEDERADLGAYWTEVALMEHASIAAFARFTMDLLAFGAPPELLMDAQQALADETIHAKDAFALASAYIGRSVGPGRLSSASRSEEERDVILTTIVEGCIGESIAAVEAREALAGATDPAVVAALSRVAEDEARHAELAFRFIQFVLAGSDRVLAATTARALLDAADTEVAFAEPRAIVSSLRTLSHGMLPGALRREIRRSVLRDVVRPAAEALVRRYVPSFAMTTRFRPPCLAT